MIHIEMNDARFATRHHALCDQPAHVSVVTDDEGLSWIAYDSRSVAEGELAAVIKGANVMDDYDDSWARIARFLRAAGAWVIDCNGIAA